MADAQNPPVLNQSTKWSTTKTINTLIINPIKPIVSQFNGAVIVFKNAPNVAFTTANTTATINAHINQSTCTPGTIYAATNTATAESNKCTINFMARLLGDKVLGIVEFENKKARKELNFLKQKKSL